MKMEDLPPPRPQIKKKKEKNVSHLQDECGGVGGGISVKAEPLETDLLEQSVNTN